MPKPKRVTVLRPPGPSWAIGRNGRHFHAIRAPRAFTDDPPGFVTEKDPRGKASNVWFDLPPATGNSPYHLDLSTILEDQAMKQITAKKRLVFHSLGDSGGVNTTTYQQNVASYLELDFDRQDAEGANPSFFYHLGDVVYYDGEIKNYYWEFYEPYLHYPAPIFAIPGNHDGDVDPEDPFNKPSDSLKGFVRNFCSQAPVHLSEADDAPRDAMTQPNVYWTLLTPLVTIVGLYSNVPEGGRLAPDQISWFEQELANAPKDLPLIVAVHHPLYSAYGPHPGSQFLKKVFERATKTAHRIPNLILNGHVHDYQRFTGIVNDKHVVCVVAGAGGYNQKLHRLDARIFKPSGCPYKFQNSPETLDAFNDTQHGYLLVSVDEKEIEGSYMAVDDPTAAKPAPTATAKPYDRFAIKSGGSWNWTP
jgi:acid phosphatase type 7